MTARYTFEITRTRAPTDPHAFARGPQSYIVRVEGGRFQGGDKSEVTFDWSQALLDDLDAVRTLGCSAETRQRVGDQLRTVLGRGEWRRYEDAILADLARGLVYVLIRSDAAEVFQLPWELLSLRSSGQHLGEIARLHLGYAWSATEPTGTIRELGRVLLAWSDAGGPVPAATHTRVLHNAFGKGFDPDADVLAHAGLDSLGEALEAAAEADRPVRALHLLAHGVPLDQGYGLALTDAEVGADSPVSPAQLRAVLDPFKEQLRLVVLCACDGANPGAPGSHVGALAQALHRLGIPWVVASRYPLSKSGSKRFAEGFFEPLLGQGVSVEAAFAASRRRLLRQARHRDWASLVLYVSEADHGRHGGLLQSPPEPAAAGAASWVRGTVRRTVRTVTRTRTRVAALIAVVALALTVSIGLFLPRLKIEPIPDGRGVVVAGPWLASGETRDACAHLCRALRARGEQAVRCVSLAPLEPSDTGLEKAAQAAGATLVIRVTPGPMARILPVGADADASLLRSLPAVSIARESTQTVFAHIVHALALGPEAMDRGAAGALPVSAAREMPWRVTALVVLVRQLAGGPWRQNERTALMDSAERCRRDTGVSDGHCALLGFLVYGTDIATAAEHAGARLDELCRQAPAVLADQACIALLERECASDAAIAALVRLAVEPNGPTSGCKRWQLMTPAACALDFARRGDGVEVASETLAVLAELAALAPDHDEQTCPLASQADAYYARGSMWGGRTEPSLATWLAAVESYAAANRLAPERSNTRQALAETLLLASQMDEEHAGEYAARAVSVLTQPGAEWRRNAAEAFLLWVAQEASAKKPASGVAHLCTLYHQAPAGRSVMPYVDRRVACAQGGTAAGKGKIADACGLWHLLKEQKPVTGTSELAEVYCPRQPDRG